MLIEHYRRSNAVAAMDPPLSVAELRDLDEAIARLSEWVRPHLALDRLRP